MIFRAINNKIDFDKFISILLVLGVYFKTTKLDILLLLIIQYTIVMKKALNKIYKYITLQQVNNRLNN